MCKYILSCLVFLPAGVAPAQFQPAKTPYEAVVVDMLNAMQRMNGAMKSVQNPTSAQAARALLKDAVSRFVSARKKAEKMKLPKLDEKNRIEQKYAKKMAGAIAEFFLERRRVRGIPGGLNVLEELKPLSTAKKKSADKQKSNVKQSNFPG